MFFQLIHFLESFSCVRQFLKRCLCVKPHFRLFINMLNTQCQMLLELHGSTITLNPLTREVKNIWWSCNNSTCQAVEAPSEQSVLQLNVLHGKMSKCKDLRDFDRSCEVFPVCVGWYLPWFELRGLLGCTVPPMKTQTYPHPPEKKRQVGRGVF